MRETLHYSRFSDIADSAGRRWYRFFEMVPALLAWATILGIFFVSWYAPVFASFFIIAFDIYWLLKTVFLSMHLRAGYREMQRRMVMDWMQKLEGIRAFPSELNVSSWRDIRHLVILPFYREPHTIVAEAVAAIRNNTFPAKNIFLVLGAEARVGDEAVATGKRLEEEYGSAFGGFLVAVHPQGISGELPGKGSNEAWALQKAKERFIDSAGIPPEHVVVSSLDIDTIVPPQYFACVTYHYCTVARPLRSSYQPIPIYNNNIWDAPAFSRVVATSGTFWQTMQQARPERLTTFSSHSVPLQALIDIGLWQTNIVSEDSRIFWQCLLRYDGDYRVTPLFYPVYMDANVGQTVWETAKNVYKQQRRWGWGVENVPYILFGFLKNKNIPFRRKLYFCFNQFEGFWSWATNAFILFFLGWLPVLIGGQAFGSTVLSYNLPRITRIIMTLTMVGLVTSAIISTSLLPPRPRHAPLRQYLWMVLQWILLPVTIVFFGSLPGLEAQTRLARGKRLDFWVTPKYRSPS